MHLFSFYSSHYVVGKMHGLVLASSSWKIHVDKKILKFGGAYIAFRIICHIDTFKSVCIACFHSIMKYGIILWCNLFHNERVLHEQKLKC